MKAIAGALLVIFGAGASAAAAPPQQLYTLNCWGCHQPHAEGIPGTVPQLAHSMGYFARIPGGREYLIRVPGVANSPLNDAQVAEVLNWLLLTFSKDELPPGFAPYRADEVRKWRSQPLVDVKKARSELAGKLAAGGYIVAPIN